MEPNETSQSTPQSITQPITTNSSVMAPRPRTPLSKILLPIVIIAAVISTGGVYYWQNQKLRRAESKASNPTSTASVPVTPQQKPATSMAAYATNVGLAYPLGNTSKKAIYTLSLPAGNSIIELSPSAHSQSELLAYYVNSFNDILAHWLFTTNGTSAQPTNSLDSLNDITVSALDGWAKANDPQSVVYGDTIPSTNAMSVSQKTKFIADLKATTASCAKDSAKGFQTEDKVYSICYSLQHPQAQGGSWMLSLRGYGELDTIPTYLRGNIALSSDTQAPSYIDALRKTTTVFTNK